jgi:hypothetical protein
MFNTVPPNGRIQLWETNAAGQRLGDVVRERKDDFVRYAAVVGTKAGEVVTTVAAASVAFVLALWASNLALYDGKAFGGFKDFVGAVVAGIALTAIVDAVVAGATWARGGIAALRTNAAK